MKAPSFADVAAEREIIGALLMDPETFLDVRGILKPEMFHHRQLGLTFKAFVMQYEKKALTDLRTLAKVAEVSPQMLAECLTEDIIPSLVLPKARKVRDLFHKRHITWQIQQTLAQLETLTPEEIAKRFSDLAAEVTISNNSKVVFDAAALCRRVMKLQEGREDPDKPDGPGTGYSLLDKLLRGISPKRMTVIAAATGFGKSTLALNLFFNLLTARHRALFISNENDVDLNLDRMCGILSGLKVKDIESGNCPEIAVAFGKEFYTTGMFMTDSSPRTIEEITSLITRYVIQHKIEVAFVDYIGEISHSGDSKETEEARLARFAQKLVDCAKALGIHIVVMAQLNRQGNAKGRPTKAELAGCFKIAQKAHSLLLFWQDDKKRDILTIDKNRQGPVGLDIEMQFDRTTQRITEIRILTAD
ncbi:AAA family ATPase [Geomonas sp. RF6]|uniref:DnaB-like helicase C-terminal domain-containing protein n=1 Tax=Geomonas sp. RF6 TaxID=2897342 RepID=UPI001E3B6DC8|nr:DnaB-like helicase C-terminal domain-containing protein [Geomonas sp. RF6]UFS69468.1 AAA family ATPase [Geomonas sp. RF6]